MPEESLGGIECQMKESEGSAVSGVEEDVIRQMKRNILHCCGKLDG